jgi:hypothetical protein
LSNTTIEASTKSITFSLDRLSLAVYREIAAHLRQVEGVKTDLLPQTATNFDYLQSQVGGLNIVYPSDSSIETKIKSILRHYENKYRK